MAVLRVVALWLFVVAAFYAFGWWVAPSLSRAVGMIALAYGLLTLSSIPPPSSLS